MFYPCPHNNRNPWFAIALFALMAICASLSRCGGDPAKDTPSIADLEAFVSKQAINSAVIHKDGALLGKACFAVRLIHGRTPNAVTLCNHVFVCKQYAEDNVEYLCLLAHELKHVEQQTAKVKECAKGIYAYGAEYYVRRLIFKQSDFDAYLSLEDEKEARNAQAECLALFGGL